MFEEKSVDLWPIAHLLMSWRVDGPMSDGGMIEYPAAVFFRPIGAKGSDA